MTWAEYLAKMERVAKCAANPVTPAEEILARDIPRLTARVRELTEALQLYADENNYRYFPYPNDTPARITIDRGATARAVLAKEVPK